MREREIEYQYHTYVISVCAELGPDSCTRLGPESPHVCLRVRADTRSTTADTCTCTAHVPAGAATAPPLADAVVRLVIRGSSSSASPAAVAAALRAGRWQSHPLVAVLLSCPAAATQLLSSAMGALAAAATAAAATAATATAAASAGGAAGGAATAAAAAVAAAAALEGAWAALEPFFSFVLLQVRAAAEGVWLGLCGAADEPSVQGGMVGYRWGCLHHP